MKTKINVSCKNGANMYAVVKTNNRNEVKVGVSVCQYGIPGSILQWMKKSDLISKQNCLQFLMNSAAALESDEIEAVRQELIRIITFSRKALYLSNTVSISQAYSTVCYKLACKAEEQKNMPEEDRDVFIRTENEGGKNLEFFYVKNKYFKELLEVEAGYLGYTKNKFFADATMLEVFRSSLGRQDYGIKLGGKTKFRMKLLKQ